MATLPDLRTVPATTHESALPLELLPFPAVLVDRDGIITAANPEWLRAHPQAARGDDCRKWCSSLQHAGKEICAALLLGVEGALSCNRRFSQSYGEDRRYFITISPSATGALLVCQDLAPELPAPSTPPQAQKMETVGRLVGGVAHDFANLVTLIAGYSELLLNRIGEKNSLCPELEEIRKAAHRGSRLTSQLLDFTRAQAVHPAVIELNSLIGDVHRMLRPIIGEYIELQTSLAPNLAEVVADPGQMEQVIMNLILNARDAMPSGGRIRIETANRYLQDEIARELGVNEGPYVFFSVSDTGHGIDPQTMEHLFEPFFTTKEKGKGTGLGLATVREVVKQWGGAVWACSSPGEGAIFTVGLPCAQRPEGLGETVASPGPAAAGNETVLLVEDEDGVRRLLMHVLTKRGYNVIEAPDGEEALRIFEQRAGDIHLVLTDMVMPKMSGRELGQRLSRIRPEAKVIYMSGYTDDVLVRTGALGPGMAFLQKPLRPEVLAAKVRETLDSPSRQFDPR